MTQEPNPPATVLTAARVASAIEKLKSVRPNPIDAYLRIQGALAATDVASDEEFQRAFVRFYRVRRNKPWRMHFFRMLNDRKGMPWSFEEALLALRDATGRVEASFASKLVATIDPLQPVIDSEVFRHLKLRLPYRTDPDRVAKIVAVHRCLARWYMDAVGSTAGIEALHRFRTHFPDVELSEVKALDLLLWQMRDAGSSEIRPRRRGVAKKLDVLAGFLSAFEAADFKFGQWVRSPAEANVQVLPYFSPGPTAHRFVQTCYDEGWVLTDFDWPAWMATDHARQLRDDPDAFAGASADELARLLTVFIRQDRFVEGALERAFEAGLLTRICRRAAALRDAELSFRSAD